MSLSYEQQRILLERFGRPQILHQVPQRAVPVSIMHAPASTRGVIDAAGNCNSEVYD